MLQKDQTSQGLWFTPAWTPKQPGTFAVVIGVSKYEYLHDDEQSYRLGQLHVSALTAYRFFCWLGDHYRHPDFPLAKVWLLLSPTNKELTQMAGFPETGFRQPTFASCETAIGEWYAAMQGLDSTVSERSRAIFFFSGHGLEVTQDRQILLPSDYLSPPLRNVNKALSTLNLYTGLRATPLPQHLFFMDACRNDHEKLREMAPEGTPVLNPCPSWRVRSDIISPIIYATGPGAAAWAPDDPKQGISVFGKALLEGLECVEGVEALQADQRYWVTLRGLQDYMDPRVQTLLQEAGLRVSQPVRITYSTKTPICEVPPPAGVHSLAPSAPMASVPSLSSVLLPAGWRGPSDSGDWSQLWDIFHSESFTDRLWDARVFDLATLQWEDLKESTAKRPLSIKEISRTEDKHTYKIDIEMHRYSPQWLEFADKPAGKKAACVLIGDRERYPHYSLGLDFKDAPGGPVISGLEVSLSGSDSPVLNSAAEVWRKYRNAQLDKSGTPGEFELLELALREKEESPLAATVAALLLLRAWRPDLLHNWPRNLADRFPEHPDGCVIWAEQLLRTGQDKKMNEAIDWLLQLEHRGLPHTSEALGHAARQIKELLEFAFPEPAKRTDEQQRRHEALQKLQGRLNRALTVFRPGGLCAVFIGPEAEVTPDLILSA